MTRAIITHRPGNPRYGKQCRERADFARSGSRGAGRWTPACEPRPVLRASAAMDNQHRCRDRFHHQVPPPSSLGVVVPERVHGIGTERSDRTSSRLAGPAAAA